LQSKEDTIAYAHVGLNTVMGPRGLVAINNYIALHYGKGVKVVLLHDDIEDVQRVHRVQVGSEGDSDDHTELVSVDSLDDWFISMFKRMKAAGRNLGDVYPVRNAGWMLQGKGYRLGPDFVYAPLTLMINQQALVPVEHEEKEDFVRRVSSTPCSMAG
jgi:hypothetical protein